MSAQKADSTSMKESFVEMSSVPMPYNSTAEGRGLEERLMPVTGLTYGVASVGYTNVPGGYRMIVRVVPRHNRGVIECLISRYAAGRDVVIEPVEEYGSCH